MEEADDFRSRLVPGADLRGVTFPSFDNLDGVDLHGADLRGADLRKVNWWGEGEVQLSNTDFSGADLRGAWLGAPIFDGANLSGANLSGLDLKRGQFAATSFAGADLTGADLSHVNISGGTFDGAVLDGANLDGAVLTSCTLRNASLVGTSLIGANLRESTLTAADLRGANLTSAALPDGPSAFAAARFDASTQWREEMRSKAQANSVAGPDGTHVINSPPPPTPALPAQQSGHIGKVVGRVAAVLFGAGLTIYAVLYLTGHVSTLGRFEAKPDVLDNAVVGMLFTVGAASLLGGIVGLSEESRSSSRRSRGDTDFDGDSCGIDAD
ncbi:pentapeptide repeat-containing protein [Lentzea sp. BCCO 10_0856]|uniref:Pentapeptide repeat-containing protein n=1 Tax=Lentzea miocenica TaxID=3095431 RepID=A0ABU4SWU9_9PSEU|nr:pentapeptide repeat-containing protein [Lentzea sp. BCCO 10_0856]MDX8030393.1 pentapeptide repeat-containing protein [Lentzea sp. BCCO 10_0856]